MKEGRKHRRVQKQNRAHTQLIKLDVSQAFFLRHRLTVLGLPARHALIVLRLHCSALVPLQVRHIDHGPFKAFRLKEKILHVDVVRFPEDLLGGFAAHHFRAVALAVVPEAYSSNKKNPRKKGN